MAALCCSLQRTWPSRRVSWYATRISNRPFPILPARKCCINYRGQREMDRFRVPSASAFARNARLHAEISCVRAGIEGKTRKDRNSLILGGNLAWEESSTWNLLTANQLVNRWMTCLVSTLSDRNNHRLTLWRLKMFLKFTFEVKICYWRPWTLSLLQSAPMGAHFALLESNWR